MRDKAINILGVCGSLNPASQTRHALGPATQAAEKVGAQVNIVDLRDYSLPVLYSSAQSTNGGTDIEKMKRAYQQADGLIIATPEYHGSFSGALKNSFDLMGFDEFEGKIVGLIGVGGGAFGGINPIGHLRDVLRALHAWVLPDQVAISNSYEAFDEQGQLRDQKMQSRIRNLGETVVKYALLHKESQSAEFIKLWEGCVKNPGGSAH